MDNPRKGNGRKVFIKGLIGHPATKLAGLCPNLQIDPQTQLTAQDLSRVVQDPAAFEKLITTVFIGGAFKRKTVGVPTHERLQKVLRARVLDEMTLDAAGNYVGNHKVTSVFARQLEVKALVYLRHYLDGKSI